MDPRGASSPHHLKPSPPPSDESSPATTHHHHELRRYRSTLVSWSLRCRLLCLVALVTLAAVQQGFDSSPHLVTLALDPQNHHGLSFGEYAWLKAFIRWDTVYFVSLAAPAHLAASHDPRFPGVGGYTHEQMLAFQPGIVALLRLTGYLSPTAGWSPVSAILLTTLLANLATFAAPLIFFRLTWRHTRSASFAFLAAALSLAAPTAATTLSSPTPEPFFSLFALLGMLALAPATCDTGAAPTRSPRLARLVAACCFAAATAFRANGVLLSGFLLWDLFWIEAAPTWLATLASCAEAFVLVSLAVAPLAVTQVWAYRRFCVADPGEVLRPWCAEGMRSVYSFVQRHYWDSGFLLYWRPEQLPNFLIAAPVLAVTGYAVASYYRDADIATILASLLPASLRPFKPRAPRERDTSRLPVLVFEAHPSLQPHVLLTAVLTATLLLASHVQIALRFATPGALPAYFWWIASLAPRAFGERRANGSWAEKLLAGWIGLWISWGTLLYAGFYPPA
ncbi:ER membrane glycoprotein subunit of the GPI transamidase complex-like protein [Thecaphora frezii]